MKRLNKISGGKVLDVATGRGEFIRVLKDVLMDHREFIGIDNSDRSVAFATNAFAAEPVSIEKMDATAMSWSEGSFDTVAISNSLHHMDKLDAVLSEMGRVLRTGGHFLVSEMVCDADQSPAQMTHVLLHHWWGRIDTCLGTTHRPTYTRAQLDEIMRAVPLRSLESYTFSYPMENPHDPEFVDRLMQMMDPYVERISEHVDFQSLKAEGETLKQRLQDTGYASAQSMFFIGKK
ncbi:MAG: class I SAM-dependent methyltransferase [Candidatus Cloacimonetes bacterium]|nr:class I SAM-dependent methyltransferase [Candidatus Cloacimonadota bacterium]